MRNWAQIEGEMNNVIMRMKATGDLLASIDPKKHLAGDTIEGSGYSIYNDAVDLGKLQEELLKLHLEELKS